MIKDKKWFLWSFLPSIIVIVSYIISYKFLPDQVITHISKLYMESKKINLQIMFVPLFLTLLGNPFAPFY